MQTDYIHLYQFHHPDPHTPIEASWATMQALVQQGKVRYGGLSNYTLELMQRAMAVAPITSNQHQYNLLHRKIEHDVILSEAKDLAQPHAVGVLAWSPLASGFLTDGFDLESLDPYDFRRRHSYAEEPTCSSPIYRGSSSEYGVHSRLLPRTTIKRWPIWPLPASCDRLP